MKTNTFVTKTIFVPSLIFFMCTFAPAFANGSGGGETDTAGNNLSFPVIWAEGITKTLPGTLGMIPELEGEWWYHWDKTGADPNVEDVSCSPDPDESDSELNPDGFPYCDDSAPSSLTIIAGQNANATEDLVKAFLQKDPGNTWQAESADGSASPVIVDWIDWGDNLESVDWYTNSKVRTEVVLFQDLAVPMTSYEMRHVSGWGIDEVHGLAASLEEKVAYLAPGTQATVYSHCARMTIQKLLFERDTADLKSLIWTPKKGWENPKDSEGNIIPLINEPIFNSSVYEGGPGPDYYSAEINVKGRVIYGYTWNVLKVNDTSPTSPNTKLSAAGDYRITYSFDETCGLDENTAPKLNTSFVEGTTEIQVPTEEEVETSILAVDTASTDDGGGVADIDFANNLTYIDVRILERSGGGGKKK